MKYYTRGMLVTHIAVIQAIWTHSTPCGQLTNSSQCSQNNTTYNRLFSEPPTASGRRQDSPSWIHLDSPRIGPQCPVSWAR